MFTSPHLQINAKLNLQNLFPTQEHMVVSLQFNKISDIATYHRLNWQDISTWFTQVHCKQQPYDQVWTWSSSAPSQLWNTHLKATPCSKPCIKMIPLLVIAKPNLNMICHWMIRADSDHWPIEFPAMQQFCGKTNKVIRSKTKEWVQ